jgi:hypothetical protein
VKGRAPARNFSEQHETVPSDSGPEKSDGEYDSRKQDSSEIATSLPAAGAQLHLFGRQEQDIAEQYKR